MTAVKTTILPVLLALCLQGCAMLAPRLDVSVDGIAASGFERTAGGSYYLAPSRDELSGTLLWAEVRRRIGEAFAAEGLAVTEDFRSARFVARVEYAVSEPRTQVESYVVPTYGVVGVTTRRVDDGHGRRPPATVTSPSYGVTGGQTVTSARDVYTKRIAIRAYRSTAGAGSEAPSFDRREVWVTELTSTDHRDDLRRLVPHMLRAASGLLGTDTHGRTVRTVRLDDRGQDAPGRSPEGK